MNYDHLNLIHDYWRNDIYPHFVHCMSVHSFDDYLKRFSYLPSGKWLKDFEKVKVARIPFLVDPLQLVVKYKSMCVAYNAPGKIEEGIMRAIYQLSPTLHFETGFWIWIENDTIQSYATVFVCYHDEKEYFKFIDEMYKIRREGNTENKSTPPGFKDMRLSDAE